MKNPIIPKPGQIFTDPNGWVYCVSKVSYNDELMKQVELYLLINPKTKKIVPYDEFLSPIDLERYPKLRGFRSWTYEYLSE